MDRQYREKLDHLLANNGEPSDPLPEEQRQLAELFPCLEPANPHMNSMARRTATFKSRWPRQKVRASIEQIAKAGFFFLGNSDKTKCFYCNGGLQNWDYNDEPWTEHAKWFPGCEFVLRMKGIHFVRRLQEAHPNLNRPLIRNPVSLGDLPNELPSTSRNSSPEIAAPERDINIAKLQSLGFSRKQIESATTRQGSNRSTIEDLVADLQGQTVSESENTIDGNSHTGNKPRTSDHYGATKECRQYSPKSVAKQNNNAFYYSRTLHGNDEARTEEEEAHLRNGCPRQELQGRTEGDACPIVYSTTSDAELTTPRYSFMRDNTREIHRLVSFGEWREFSVSSIRFAAKEGFYYTGNGDEARCFSCTGIWYIRQAAYTSNLHSSNCEMMHQRAESGNVPYMTGFSEVQELIQRSLTPHSQPTASVEENEALPHAASKFSRSVGPGPSLPQ